MSRVSPSWNKKPTTLIIQFLSFILLDTLWYISNRSKYLRDQTNIINNNNVHPGHDLDLHIIMSISHPKMNPNLNIKIFTVAPSTSSFNTP